jgi:hypothetical protein
VGDFLGAQQQGSLAATAVCEIQMLKHGRLPSNRVLQSGWAASIVPEQLLRWPAADLRRWAPREKP